MSFSAKWWHKKKEQARHSSKYVLCENWLCVHCLVSKLALLGYGNRLAPLFKILNYCFQGGVTPIRPVLALATAVKILDRLF